jgi:ADP-glucose pyrophosphorylase
MLLLYGQKNKSCVRVQDYMDLLKTHRENDADITIATHSVGWGQAPLRGLTRVDPDTGTRSFANSACNFLVAAVVAWMSEASAITGCQGDHH